MKQGGRPRRSEEQPDSAFGEALKGHLRRVKDFTQTELARESFIPEKTLSHMVKGRRTGGPTLRRDLRSIIRVFYQKKALLTLEEANRLITTIPAISALDKRDPDDAEIISLFDTPVTEIEQAAAQSNDAAASPNVRASSDSRDDATASDAMPEPTITPLPILPSSTSETTTGMGRKTKKRLWWYVGSVLVALIVILGTVLVITRSAFSGNTDTCSANTNGVTLYTDINYQGQCHTFGPGDYELAHVGLEQNVSSIKDPNDAYHITLFDKDKNFYYVDKDTPVLTAEWDNRTDTIHIEKHRPTSCHPGNDGIIAFINTDYSGGCLFITQNIPDLSPLNFDKVIVSIQFVGSYQNIRQLVIYKQPNYKDECGAYWQDQSDLLQCARLALSVQVLSFTPPTPIPTIRGTHYAGNIAPQAMLSPGSAHAVVDGNLHTEWIGGHMVELDLSWAFPVTTHRVVVWDRKQSASDNNQINKLKLSFSDGTSTGSIDMISQGPRCADVTFPAKTITWLHIIPVDASGNNGYSEVEVWTTTGPQYSNNTCVNKVTIPQTIPQAATTQNQVLFYSISIPVLWLAPFQRSRAAMVQGMDPYELKASVSNVR
jgi:predicted transcriptional regulator